MAIKYLADAISQKTFKDCFYTALLMLVRYHRFRVALKYGGSEIYDVELRRWLNIDTKSAKTKLSKLLHKNDVPDIVRKYDLTSEYININPTGFGKALTTFGPFLYIGTLVGTRSPSGEPWIHTVLVTGIEIKDSKYFVYYNDPNGGRKNRVEFFGFLVKLLPSFTLNNNKKVYVVHL